MKQQIKEQIKKVIAELYPEYKDIDFSVDYAPSGIDADFASNAALVLSKKIGKKPMEVAEEIAAAITPRNDSAVSVAVPGFLNFKVETKEWIDELQQVLEQGDKYGSSMINKGKRARVEYISANPTGPVHIGNARGGPYGETICRIFEAAGYKVLREYLHNDMGGQVQKLGKTVRYWYKKLTTPLVPPPQGEGKEEEAFPEGGYQGEYPKEIAAAAPKGLDLEKLTAFAIDHIFAENLETIDRLGIKFDLIVKESELQSSGKVKQAVEELKSKGFTKDKDGALWFIHPDLISPRPSSRGGGSEGGDREAVIVKSDGQPTYFASDIAYHKEKFTSGYDLVVNVLGSNHHGHVPKLKALTKVYDFPADKFIVPLYQYVRVKKGNEVVKMAKRAGTFITAKEVLDEVGKDSMIFFLLSTAVNTHMDFDLELAKDTSEKNPVYKVQYAHARINSILEKAKKESAPFPNPPHKGEGMDAGSSSYPLVGEVRRGGEEIRLIRELAKFPELVAEIAETYAVHQLPHYLLSLAEKFHSFYEKVKVLTDDEQETAGRLVLVRAVQIVIANGLRLMGITPLERM